MLDKFIATAFGVFALLAGGLAGIGLVLFLAAANISLVKWLWSIL